jgi:hypothetical protein
LILEMSCISPDGLIHTDKRNAVAFGHLRFDGAERVGASGCRSGR